MSESVGLAMIVKNGASTLETCLRSVEGLFDQLVVVDTGSTDASKEIAGKFGAEIYDYTWHDDFAAARNFSFSKLATTWAFWLDHDDCLIGREWFDEMLSKCSSKGLDGVILEYMYSFDSTGLQILDSLEPDILARSISGDRVYELLYSRCNTTQFRERLIRLDPTWQWLYPVHEALPVVGRRLGKYDKVRVVHRRHKTTAVAKTRRNLDILERVPVERRDERIWFYFGLEYASHSMLDKSIEAFEKYLPLGSVPDERYLALHYLADLYRHKGQIDQSKEYDLRALAMRPTWRDAYAGLLRSAVAQQDWSQAMYYGAKAKTAEPPDTPFAFNPMHQEVGWVADYVTALINVGEYEEALAECQRAVQIVPQEAGFMKTIDDISVVLNRSAGAETLSNTLEYMLRCDDAETAAIVLSRTAPDLITHPKMRSIVQIVDHICGAASRGVIPPDVVKMMPGAGIAAHEPEENWDIRTRFLLDRLALYPKVDTILFIGGPSRINETFCRMGFSAARADNLAQLSGVRVDAVVLWSCLERVKDPGGLVATARKIVNPGGVLFFIVPNGPARKGLASPDTAATRLRAFSIDTLRQLVGTLRMPVLTEGWSAEAGDMVLEIPQPLSTIPTRDIALVCPYAPESWGPWSLERGIGGSEEAVVRLARAFVRRGHGVTVYGSGWAGRDLVGDGGYVHYKDLVDYKPCEALIGWRYPEIFFNQLRPFEANWRGLWLHDSTDPQRVAMASSVVDSIWCISDFHAAKYAGIPKIFKGRNGIDPSEFDFSVPRNPHKAVYLSTPFRGLDTLLTYWPQIKEKVPDAELHAYYGWESADKMGVTSSPEGKAFKDKVVELCKQPGVFWRGRTGQAELYREVASAGAWLYPSRWEEENCISAYIAQAAGAWPVVFPLGALPQSVVWGWKVDPSNFVSAAVSAMETEQGRDRMMTWTRSPWVSWDECAEMWERLFLGYEG